MFLEYKELLQSQGSAITDALHINGVDMAVREYLRSGGKMQIETFAYWYLQKKIFGAAAKVNEVIYHIWKDGVFQCTMDNSEFRKRKKSLQMRGCTFTTSNLFSDLSGMRGDAEVNDEIEFADSTMRGLEEYYTREDVFKMMQRRR